VSDAVDGAVAAVFGRLGRAGVRPSAAPFIRFHELAAEGGLTMEVGVVAAADPGEGDPLVPATLPAGRFVTYLHHGAYRSSTEPDLVAARARVERWAAERGLELDRTAVAYLVAWP
jgi:hypothetical protein